MAYAMARDALPKYGHRFSPKTFTQHQLFACLVLKEFIKTGGKKGKKGDILLFSRPTSVTHRSLTLS